MMQIIVNDFKARTRRGSFLSLIAFIILVLTLVCLPKGTFAGLTTISISARYLKQMDNASWIVIAFALTYGIVFSIAEFFFIKNAEELDRQARVNNWMFSTTFSKSRYLVAKLISNLALLFIFWLVSLVVSAIISYLRFPNEMALFCSRLPYFFLLLPGLMFIASLSLIFESCSWLRSAWGNVLAVIGYLVILISNLSFGLMGKAAPLAVETLDFSHTSILLRTIVQNAYQATGSRSNEIMFLAKGHALSGGKKSLIFSLPQMQQSDWLVLVLQVILSIFLLGLAILLFKNEQQHENKLPNFKPVSKLKAVDSEIRTVSAQANIFRSLKAEFWRAFYQINYLWLAGLVILWVVVLANPVKVSLSLLPLLFIYSLGFYSKMIGQPQSHGFNSWLATLKKSKRLQFIAEVVVLLIVTLILLVPVLIKTDEQLSLLLIGIMTVLLAEVSMRVLKNAKVFEIIMTLYWFIYLNDLQILNNIGVYLMIDIGLLAILMIGVKLVRK